MTPKGKVNLFSQIAVNRGFENVDTWFQTTGNYDATIRARRESNDILWYGGRDLPAPEDNDEVHLTEHKPIHAAYVLLPPEEQNTAAVQHHKLHIQQHEAQMERKKSSMSQAAQQPAATPPPTPGEAAGDMIAAPMGGAEIPA